MPFSHDGEDFLLLLEEEDEYRIMKTAVGQEQGVSIKALYNDLLHVMQEWLPDIQFGQFLEDFASTLTGSKNFKGDASTAKPHEIMSVIVALTRYRGFLQENKVDFDLFARAILGLQYVSNLEAHRVISNALIQLLNSSIIDVDRLDYII